MTLHTITIAVVVLLIAISNVFIAIDVGTARRRATMFRCCVLLGIMAILASLSYLTDVIASVK